MKKIIILSALLLPAIILTGCGWQKTGENQNKGEARPSAGEQTQTADNPPIENQAQEQTLSEAKIYKSNDYGFGFAYNSTWTAFSINDGEEHNNSNPYIIVNAGKTTDEPCITPGCLVKPGDREELTKGTFPGSQFLIPWFKVLQVRGDRWVSVKLMDPEKKCIAEAACQQFLSSIPLDEKEKKAGADYKTYNDFLNLISTLKITK